MIRRNSIRHAGCMVLACLLGFWCVPTMAAPTAQSAEQFIQNNANRLLSALDQHKGEWEKYPKKLEGLVRKIILPHVDSTAMARATVNRVVWAKASASQHKAFVKAFETMVIRTYSTAFQEYNGEKVQVLPSRQPVKNGMILIDTLIHLHNGTDVEVDYRLSYERTEWMIYDFTVEGVSLVQNYRAQFDAQMSSQKGLAGLTETLVDHNRKTAPK